MTNAKKRPKYFLIYKTWEKWDKTIQQYKHTTWTRVCIIVKLMKGTRFVLMKGKKHTSKRKINPLILLLQET